MNALIRASCIALAGMSASIAPAARAGQGALVLEASDGHAYARYGQTLAYVVTLTNNGTTVASGVAVTATLSPAWDAAAASWTCYPGTDGATCTASGSGPLDDVASLPPGARVTWVLQLPVRIDVEDATATVDFGAAGAAPASDTNALVIYKDGFDVPYGDGTQRAPESGADPDEAAAAD
jgi:uncharacterized repeat protein (TIGR01451 family)